MRCAAFLLGSLWLLPPAPDLPAFSETWGPRSINDAVSWRSPLLAQNPAFGELLSALLLHHLLSSFSYFVAHFVFSLIFPHLSLLP